MSIAPESRAAARRRRHSAPATRQPRRRESTIVSPRRWGSPPPPLFDGRARDRRRAIAIPDFPDDSRANGRGDRTAGTRDARRARTPDLFLLQRQWMNRFRCGITVGPNGLATIVFVVLGAASSSAQIPGSSTVQGRASSSVRADVIATPEPRACPSTNAGTVRIPESIQVSDDLMPRLHVMLEKSATFRSQCRRIAAATQLYVRVKLDVRLSGRTYRAVTKICRRRSGAIVAAIDITPFGDPAEWVAHEFEHLIEQLDGVNLRDLERRRQGAWKSGNQMFETERAIRVGRRVSRELREPPISARLGDGAAVDPGGR
jgi:hypothetical protein